MKKNLMWILLGAFLIWIYLQMKMKPSMPLQTSPLPVNLYTNGSANGNGMDVALRKNFRQQPYG